MAFDNRDGVNAIKSIEIGFPEPNGEKGRQQSFFRPM